MSSDATRKCASSRTKEARNEKEENQTNGTKKGANKKKYRTKKLYLVLYLWFILQKMPRLKRNVRTETNNQPETSADKVDGEETTSCQNTKPKVSHDFIPCLHNITHPPDLTALLLKYVSYELRTMSTQDFCRKVSLWHKKKLHVDDRWKLDGITVYNQTRRGRCVLSPVRIQEREATLVLGSLGTCALSGGNMSLHQTCWRTLTEQDDMN